MCVSASDINFYCKERNNKIKHNILRDYSSSTLRSSRYFHISLFNSLFYSTLPSPHYTHYLEPLPCHQTALTISRNTSLTNSQRTSKISTYVTYRVPNTPFIKLFKLHYS